MAVETFIKAARAKIEPDGYLPNGLPFIRAATLERLEKQTEATPMQTIRKTATPHFLDAVSHAIMTAKTSDEAATIAHRAEQVIKARVREEREEPYEKERKAKLDAIVATAHKLYKLGGYSSMDAAINAAMRALADQNNSPGIDLIGIAPKSRGRSWPS